MSKTLFTRVVPAVAVASVLSLSMLAGCSMQDEGKNDNSGGVIEETIVEDGSSMGGQGTNAIMTEDEAKAIAFEDAGILESDATNVKVEKKTEDGVEVYDIEFDANGASYDYVIDAMTGALIEYDEEIVVIGGSTMNGTSGSASSGSSAGTGSGAGSGANGGTGNASGSGSSSGTSGSASGSK